MTAARRSLGAGALLCAAASAWAGHFSVAAGRMDCPGVANSYACAMAVEHSLQLPFLHRPAAGRLEVELADGRIRAFVDVDAQGTSARLYNAVEATADGRYVVIHRQYYEGDDYGILDRGSGTFTPFHGYPLFSPDHHWLAVADGGEDQDGVLRIYRVAADGSFQPAFDAHPGRWWPEQVQWLDSGRLGYQHTSLLDSGNRAMEPAELRFAAGAWQDTDAPHQHAGVPEAR